jgi:hypothetical protein
MRSIETFVKKKMTYIYSHLQTKLFLTKTALSNFGVTFALLLLLSCQIIIYTFYHFSA